MPRAELAAASEALRDAAELVPDTGVEERMYDQSRSLADLAAADRGPDHGRLARIENTLRELEEAASGEAASLVADAHEHVVAYREGVEGV